MSLLIYSNKCQHSNKLIEFLNKNQQLKNVIKLHCIDTHGVPPEYKNYIKSVPTIVTHKKQILVGQECKTWLESLLPPVEIGHCSLSGSGCNFGSIDGNESLDGFFELDNYGVSLQPSNTPQIHEKKTKKLS